ncbi:PHA/PHB synthase family protein [Streptomyces achromogenes]|uniref:PHA/PHB synthase family protein n=1 Tax=Streptomyces achromogenes TaxID=67255 RepID=UPI0036C74CF0
MTAEGRDRSAPFPYLSPAIPSLRLLRPDPEDSRFADRTWNFSPLHQALLQAYLASDALMRKVATASALSAPRRRQLEFAARTLTDALAPTNFLPANPTAVRVAVASHGASLLRGARNFLDDLAHNGGRPAKLPPGSFRLGRDLAATPGQVVYRNHLMEVLQYEPQTRQVYTAPLLLLPAWVNKYYIYDLAPGRSLVEYAVRQGFTVFAVSLRDPGPDQAAHGLEDYFIDVAARALDIVEDICGTRRTHVVGLCAGGLLAGLLTAWLAAASEQRTSSLSLLMAGLDYTDPETGQPPGSTELLRLADLMLGREKLVSGRRIGLVFDLLRANDTLWKPLTRGWLQGDRPAPFDIAAWSEDSIAVARPLFRESMHLMGDNLFARGNITLGGRRLRLSDITVDTFVVASARDHIVPWESVYLGARSLGGKASFRLIPSGHVGAVINPPRPNATHLRGQKRLPEDPARWLAGAHERPESWWTAWSRWLARRSGPRTTARPCGNRHYPARERAPGVYVHGRLGTPSSRNIPP